MTIINSVITIAGYFIDILGIFDLPLLPAVLGLIIYLSIDREIEEMDVPGELFDVFKLLKVGINGAEIIRRSCSSLRRKHPKAWGTYFGKKYASAIGQLLDGEMTKVFARQLGVKLPSTNKIKLG